MAIGESKAYLTAIEYFAQLFNEPDFGEKIANGEYIILDSKPDEIMCIPTPSGKPIKIVFENGKKIDMIKGDDEDDESSAND